MGRRQKTRDERIIRGDRHERYAANPADLIESLPDVLAAVANAPLEDEEISADEERAVAEARDSLKGSEGRGTSHAEAMRGLGLDRV